MIVDMETKRDIFVEKWSVTFLFISWSAQQNSADLASKSIYSSHLIARLVFQDKSKKKTMSSLFECTHCMKQCYLC